MKTKTIIALTISLLASQAFVSCVENDETAIVNCKVTIKNTFPEVIPADAKIIDGKATFYETNSGTTYARDLNSEEDLMLPVGLYIMYFQSRRNAEFQIGSAEHVQCELHVLDVVHVMRHVDMLRQNLLPVDFLVFLGLHVEPVKVIGNERFREPFRREVHRRKPHRTMPVHAEATHLLFGEDDRVAFDSRDGRILVESNQLVIRRERRGHHLVAPVRPAQELELRLVNDPEAALFLHHEVVHLDGSEIFGYVVLNHEYSLGKSHLSGYVNISRGDCPRLLENKRVFRQSVDIDHTPNIYYLSPKSSFSLTKNVNPGGAYRGNNLYGI